MTITAPFSKPTDCISNNAEKRLKILKTRKNTRCFWIDLNSLDQVGPKTRPAWFRRRLAGSILIGRGRVSFPSLQSRRGSGRMRRRSSTLESYQRSAAGRGGGGGKLKAEILFRLAKVIGYNLQRKLYCVTLHK